MDAIFLNLRYFLVAIGVALAANICNGCIGNGAVEQIVGIVIAGLTWVWGNYVKWGTKSVPESVAARPDVPTVSAGTGAVQP
jgi:hypothetical protein